jgi:hypothetical protein
MPVVLKRRAGQGRDCSSKILVDRSARDAQEFRNVGQASMVSAGEEDEELSQRK